MKKHNVLMRASGILLVLTLATSCFVGGTFAKYVTTDTATDNARVAKWGVTVDIDDEFFAQSYSKDYTGSNVAANTVVSSDKWNVIAPGTKKEFGGIRITGSPEVAVEVKTEATVDLGTEADWTVGGEFYCPLVFNIGGCIIEGVKYSDKTTGGFNSLKTDIQNAIAATVSGEYAANTPLANVGKWEAYNAENAGKYGVKNTTAGRDKTLFCDYDEDEYVDFMWAWPFEGKETGTQVTWYQKDGRTVTSTLTGTYDDELDTFLGEKAATDGLPQISIKLTTTVTQID